MIHHAKSFTIMLGLCELGAGIAQTWLELRAFIVNGEIRAIRSAKFYSDPAMHRSVDMIDSDELWCPITTRAP